jgi:hypothetical protein
MAVPKKVRLDNIRSISVYVHLLYKIYPYNAGPVARTATTCKCLLGMTVGISCRRLISLKSRDSKTQAIQLRPSHAIVPKPSPEVNGGEITIEQKADAETYWRVLSS